MLEVNINYLIFFVFLLIGYITLSVSRRFKLIEPLILFFLGLVMQYFVDIEFIYIIKACLVLIIFDVGAHFVPNRFKTHDLKIGKFILSTWIIYSFVFWLVLSSIWNNKPWYFNLIWGMFFSCIIVACSQFELLKSFKIKHNRLYYLTEVESNLSSSMMMIIVLCLLVIVQNFNMLSFKEIVIESIGTIAIDFGIGITLGLIMLFLIVRILKRKAAHYVTIVFAFIAYFASLYLGGNGFISIFACSLFYHNVTSKEPEMSEFKPFISNLVYVIIFLFLGYFVYVDNNVLVFSVLLFFAYITVRIMLLKLILKHTQLFVALDCPKGLATGALLLFVYKSVELCCGIKEMQLFSIIVMFFVWCIMFSYFLNMYTHKITN